MMANRQIVLASASPRRIELLHQIGIEAEVVPSRKPEIIRSNHPETVVRELSMQKASDVASTVDKDAIVIGADTVVAIDGKILGKPKTHAEACEMIHELSGREHHVLTGVTVICEGKAETFVEVTTVHVAAMSESEIQNYANSEEPMDKAGGYGIQGLFGRYITRVEGDYNNVVGLPVAHLYQVLKEKTPLIET